MKKCGLISGGLMTRGLLVGLMSGGLISSRPMSGGRICGVG